MTFYLDFFRYYYSDMSIIYNKNNNNVIYIQKIHNSIISALPFHIQYIYKKQSLGAIAYYMIAMKKKYNFCNVQN